MMSDPAYLRAFKKLTRTTPGFADLKPMEEEFYGESDRACGILLGAMVESALEGALASVLRPDLSNDLAQRLFDGDGIIATFSAKINLGFALSLFGTKAKNDLELIKMMRNAFAHCRLPIKFETPEVRAICEHLQIPDTPAKVDISVYERTPRMISMGVPDKSSPKYPRYLFAMACHSLAYHLFVFSRRTHLTSLPSSGIP
jgi:hypothetical protein